MDMATAATAAGLLFAMEFADKTQLAVMSLTARSGRFFPIVVGAAAALTLLSLLAAAVGGALTRYLPERWLSLAAGQLFLAFGVFMLWRAFRQHGTAGDEEAVESRRQAEAIGGRPAWRYAAMTFGLVFLAELGDKSQLAVVGLAADTGKWLPVFAGAALGLTAMTIVGALAGSVLQRLAPPWLLRFGPGAVFILAGGLSLAGVL